MEIPAPMFDIFETVEPTQDAAIKHGGPGKVEHRAWVEFDKRPGYWRYTVRWPGQGTSSESDEHLQTADRLMCDLKVVVSGAPFKFESWTTESVDVLIERALEKAGVVVRPDEWTLRSSSGAEVKHLVGDAGLVDGETVLYLDPQVGGGGDEEILEATIVASPDPALIGRTGKATLRENPHLSPEQRAEFEDQLRYVEGAADGWKGTPPAHGTRRRLIRDAIAEAVAENFSPEAPPSIENADSFALKLADAVESALLQTTIDEEARDSVERLDAVAEESKARGGRELHIVLDHDTPASLMHAGPKFVEIEDEKGKSIGGFEHRRDGGLERIVIPVPYPVGPVRVKCSKGGTHCWPRNPNRDGTSCLKCGTTPKEAGLDFRDDEWVQQVIMRAIIAGQEHDAPFPADVVDEVCREFGVRPSLPRNWPPIHGRREETASDEPSPRAEAEEESRFDRVLRQREEARAGEDHWKAQRDAALNLLRWLIGDLIENRSDV